MKKRIAAIMTCATLISTVFCATAFAASTPIPDITSMEAGFDTLSYSGEAYQALAETTGMPYMFFQMIR